MPELATREFWKDLQPIPDCFKPDAKPEVYLRNAPTEDERLYVPFTETVKSRPLWISPSENRWCDILMATSAGLVNRHYHPHEVFAYTISGKWGYLEHDWTATAGDFVYETPGEGHTLVAYEHEQPMRAFFIVKAAGLARREGQRGRHLRRPRLHRDVPRALRQDRRRRCLHRLPVPLTPARAARRMRASPPAGPPGLETDMAHNNNSASYENVLLCVLFLTFGFVFFDRLALSFLFPFMEQELQLSNSHLGMLSSVLALAWAVSGALVGAWSDRRGQRKPLLIVAVILFSLCSALSGLVGGFLSLLLFRGIMGLAEGPILPLSQSLMVEASSPHRRGLNMGLLQGSAAGLLGAVVGPPLLVALAEALGWRHAFIVSLLPGLLIAWLIWRHVRPDPPRAQRPAPRAEEAKGKRLALLKSRNILLCTLISCVFVTWFIVLISFTPTFLVNARGFSPATMGRLMSCLGVAWVVWGFAVPAISDRIGRRPTLVAFSLLAACCPLALLYAPNATSLGLLLLLTYTGLGCFTLFMATIPAETVSRSVIATALGLIMGLGELVGGFLAPTVAGFAADRFGLSIVMWMSCGGALLAAFLSLFLRETAPAVLARQRSAPTSVLQGNQP